MGHDHDVGMKCKVFSGRLLWRSNIVKSVVFEWTARHCSSQGSYMFSAIRYCWPISKLFTMPWFSLKRNKTTGYSNCLTGLSRYNQLTNLFPLNRRSSFRNLLISLKVNKQKKKKKNSVLASSSWLRCDFCISFSKDILLLSDLPPPPPFTLIPFHFVTFFFIPFIFFLSRGKRLRWRRWNWESLNRRRRKW